VTGLLDVLADFNPACFRDLSLHLKTVPELGFLNSEKTALHGDCLGVGLVIYWGVGERNVA
jgi:hypothetical protein